MTKLVLFSDDDFDDKAKLAYHALQVFSLNYTVNGDAVQQFIAQVQHMAQKLFDYPVTFVNCRIRITGAAG